MVLADEINRATPRTQAALLEAMEERQITVEGVTTPLPRPFLVLATQNPVELEGTFPLPEAQLDRFLVRLQLGYPDEDGEDEILVALRIAQPPRRPSAGRRGDSNWCGSPTALTHLHVDPRSGATPCESSAKPATTRRSNSVGVRAPAWRLFRTARAHAAIYGRDYVLPDDVKTMAPYVLPHRLILSTQARLARARSR